MDESLNLKTMLDRLGEGVSGRERITIKVMLEAAGSRSFSPALLVPGLVMFSPLSGIPGLPSIMALLVLLIATQLLIGRNHFWLPGVVERRSISRRKFEKMLAWLYPVAGFIDRFLKPRLTVLTRGFGTMVIAVLCILVAASVPPLEIFPFLSSAAGAILVLLSLSLIAHDGLFALVAMVVVCLLAVATWSGVVV